MNNLKERYSDLVSLTQVFIQKEYATKQTTIASPAGYAFFANRPKRQPMSRAATSSFLKKPLQASFPDPQIPTPAPNPNEPTPPLPPITPTPEPITPSPSPAPTTPSPDPQIEPIQNKAYGISNKKGFVLEPLNPPPAYQMDIDFKEVINKKYPGLPIYDAIPDDRVASKIKNTWQKENVIPPVIILTFNQDEQHTLFLKNVAKAISLRLAPARVISGLKVEAEKKWDKLIESPDIQMIIACDYGFFMQPGLKKHYREDSKQGKHFLGNKPLLLLSDLNLYLQQPQLKALLWQAICNEFALAASPNR
jgi:hypothetical protein